MVVVVVVVVAVVVVGVVVAVVVVVYRIGLPNWDEARPQGVGRPLAPGVPES